MLAKNHITVFADLFAEKACLDIEKKVKTNPKVNSLGPGSSLLASSLGWI